MMARQIKSKQTDVQVVLVLSKRIKMETILNKKEVDYTKEPMFFGEGLSLQRYDIQAHPFFYKAWKTQLSNYWRPEEVDVSRDAEQFDDLTQGEKDIFTKNLKYQILLDSVASRGMSQIVKHVSIPELEAAMSAWQFFETLHSYSYTYIIKNVYTDPTDVLDNILNQPQIMTRANELTTAFDALEGAPSNKNMYLNIMSVNILEGLRFFVSFACSYAFAETGRMEGNAKIISLINRDENIHLAMTTYMLANLDWDEVDLCKDEAIEMYRKAAKEEMAWAEHLFEDSQMLGLNADVLKQYIKWLTNKRMASIKLPPIFEKTENPIKWIQHWTESEAVQVAPQETEIESYQVGSFDHDFENLDFG